MIIPRRIPYLFLLPTLIFFICISIFPMIYAFGLSLFKEEYGRFIFCGIENFKSLLKDSTFFRALLNTFLYAVITIPCSLLISLIIALILNSNIKYIGLWRTIFFSPSITTTAAVGYIWLWIYEPYNGVIGKLTSFFHLGTIAILSDPDTALIGIAIVRIWTLIGFQVVVFMAGLATIPDEFYEVADVDGANFIQKFYYITLPLLNPTILFLIVLCTIKTLQMFTEIYVMTENGGPLGSTMTIVYLIQQTAFSSHRKGYAAAMSVILFIIILILTLVQIKLISRRVEY